MSDRLPLEGMTALITGGGGGIGSGSAKWLLKDGCSVTIMGRTESTLVDAQSWLSDFATPGATLQHFVGDATDPSQLQAALEQARQPTGDLDICVPVVGGGTIKPLLMFDQESFLDDLKVNIMPTFLAIRYAGPMLAEAGGGSIVCISSDAARMPWFYLSGYCTSKSGVEGLVRVAALELAAAKVRVNAVRPGLVDTNANRQAHAGDTETDLFSNQEVLDLFLEQKPLGRTGVPDDVGAGVRYLAGPESSWVTGQSFAIEGGNELTRAPVLEPVARATFGDAAIDAVLGGRAP
ncbi:MAG: SDR family oxidoreductase [Deltaproteobacteria bacterium]|nr:SDR family oxidoreductase [Deltaproteobacteria bacterium]